MGQGGRDRGAGRGARLRLGLGLRPLPQRAPSGQRGRVRVLDHRHRDQPTHVARATGPDGGLLTVPKPRAAGQDHVERRRHQRRPSRLGHRRGLVRPRVQGLRVRVPRGQGAHRDAARDGRDRPFDVDPAPHHLRGSPLQPAGRAMRPEAVAGPAPADLDRRRRRAAHPARGGPARRPVQFRWQARRVGAQGRGAQTPLQGRRPRLRRDREDDLGRGVRPGDRAGAGGGLEGIGASRSARTAPATSSARPSRCARRSRPTSTAVARASCPGTTTTRPTSRCVCSRRR